MVAETVEIFTQYDSPKEKAEPIHAELTSLDKGVVYRSTPLADFPYGVRHEMGTCVRLSLVGKIVNWTYPAGLGKWNNLRKIVNYWARKVPIPISIEEEGQVFSNPSKFIVPLTAIPIEDDAAGIEGYVDMGVDYDSPEAEEIQVTVQGFYVERHPLRKDSVGLCFARGKIDFSGKRDFSLTIDRNSFADFRSSQAIARAEALLIEGAAKWIEQQSIWDDYTRQRLRKLLLHTKVLHSNEDLQRLIKEKPIFRVNGKGKDQSIKEILEGEIYLFIPIIPRFRQDLYTQFQVANQFSKWYTDAIKSLWSRYHFLYTGQPEERQYMKSFIAFRARAKYMQGYPLHLLDFLCDASLEFKEGWPVIRLLPRDDTSPTHGWSRLLHHEPQKNDWLICSTDGNAYWINPFCTSREDILGNAGRIKGLNVVHVVGHKLGRAPADSFLYPQDHVIIQYELDGKRDYIEKTVMDLIMINDNIICPRDRIDYWVRKFVEEKEPSEHDINRLLMYLYLDRDSIA